MARKRIAEVSRTQRILARGSRLIGMGIPACRKAIVRKPEATSAVHATPDERAPP
jgi:hypothetical protein